MIKINTMKENTSEIEWGGESKLRQLISPEKTYCAIVDSGATWFHEEYFAGLDNVHTFAFDDPNEDKKCMSKITEILNALFEICADRSTIILAVGGGVTLDCAGFAASIFKRGINWIAVPTTLLAQVDASVGGKTAINDVNGKNTIGTFHPPKQVFITSLVSATWDKIQTLRLEGIAEMYKIFKVFDHNACQSLLKDPNNDSLTHRSVELKAKVVSVDPWERNIRAYLNYGHTLAHVIEYAIGLEHGLAVAFGIRLENAVAVSLGLMKQDVQIQIEKELDMLGFKRPTTLPPFNRLKNSLFQDKKNVGSEVMFCFVDGVTEYPIENYDPRRSVTVDVIEQAYGQYCSDHNITVSK